MKTCNTCKETKPYSEFSTKKESKDGYRHACKDCRKIESREWYSKNKERKAKTTREWYLANKDKKDKLNKEWWKNNPEKRRAKHKKFHENNPHKTREYNAKRRAYRIKATPAWANKEAIDYVYYTAKLLEDVYGTKWHVDHIVPLKGKNVCGLHTHTNLQLLPPKQNLEKSNTF